MQSGYAHPESGRQWLVEAGSTVENREEANCK